MKESRLKRPIIILVCLTMLWMTLLAGCGEPTPTVSKIDLTGTLTSSGDLSTSKPASSTSSKQQQKGSSKPTGSSKQASTASKKSTATKQQKITVTKTASIAQFPKTPTPSAEHYFDTKSGLELPYALFLPQKKTSNQKHPVVLFLHGAGERGIGGISQAGAFQRAYPIAGDLLSEAIVIAPHCPTYGWWNIDSDHGNYGDELGYLGAAMRLLQELIRQYNGDTDRIYVTGLSMGGYGTWQLLERYPDVFAAGVPVCGWGNTGAGRTFAKIPIWIYHGTADATVSFSQSENLFYAILDNGGKNVQFSILDGVGHEAWKYSYVDREMFCWMFAQKMSKQISLEHTYKPIFQVATKGGTPIFTEQDILYVDYNFYADGKPYLELELTDAAAEDLYRAHKKYAKQSFTVSYLDKTLYQYTISNPKQSNLFAFAYIEESEKFSAFYETLNTIVLQLQK